ncbi:hypothetical protein BDF19DRAFT_420385 [Syncephalis fuscata]|nr:hypothetical protein BDF19DRAFT_420385 [Syncephalis fuscata]
MSATTRTAAAVSKIDWSRLLSIPLRKDTAAQLTAFRKRFDETQRQLTSLQEQKLDVDFAHYRSVLSNKAVVDEAEKAWKAFKPVKIDLAKQQQVLDTLEAKAVQRAEQTVKQIDIDIAELQKTLSNIESARPVEQLSVEDIIEAKPEIVEVLGKRLEEGKWSIPGYEEKYGDRAIM